jgi:hypothetical protein
MKPHGMLSRSDPVMFQNGLSDHTKSDGTSPSIKNAQRWVNPDYVPVRGGFDQFKSTTSSAQAIAALDPRVRFDRDNDFAQTWRQNPTQPWADVDRMLVELDDKDPDVRRTSGMLGGWLDKSARNYFDILDDQRMVGGTSEAKAALVGPAIDDIVRGWAVSSNTTGQGQLLQEAARQQFKLKDSFRWAANAKTKRLIEVQDRASGFYRAAIKTMYDNTQDQLSDMGYNAGDTIRVYRGVDGNGVKSALETMQGQPAEWLDGRRNRLKTDDENGLIRTNIEIAQRPLSSVSVSPEEALNFVNGRGGPPNAELRGLLGGIDWDDADWPEEKVQRLENMIGALSAPDAPDTRSARLQRFLPAAKTEGGLFEMDVPIEHICSTAMTGIGCLMEQEMVLLGTPNQSTMSIEL